MSAQATVRRRGVPDMLGMKGQTPIVMLTAYSAPMAALLDPHVDMLLVGDSLGMVLYGMNSTLPVTLEMMIAHTQAVMRGSARAMVVCDLPFGSYQASPEQAFLSASRVLKETGCAAVKLEGGAEMAETIRVLVERGVPVLAHIGLMPQHVHRYGGYKTQGRDPQSAGRIRSDARAVEEAGAFALVLEGVEASLAVEITQRAAIPTIGIGASPACDGQVLVSEDMLGMFETTPSFVRRYADLRTDISNAAGRYAAEVRGRLFPEKK